MASSSNDPCVLFQYGDNPLKHHYLDQDKKLAFTLEEFQQREDPNTVVRLVRDTAWVQQHPKVHGPDRSHFYMGPNNAMGYLVYGGGTIQIPMPNMLQPGKKDGSISRYWKAQSGHWYKWKVSTHNMRCYECPHGGFSAIGLDRERPIAVWEVGLPDNGYYAKLSIQPKAMPLVTEIMTTLILNQMALALTWPAPKI